MSPALPNGGSGGFGSLPFLGQLTDNTLLGRTRPHGVGVGKLKILRRDTGYRIRRLRANLAAARGRHVQRPSFDAFGGSLGARREAEMSLAEYLESCGRP